MPTRLQLFEVMDEWMIHIERALDIDRHLDPEIPDEVHDKVSDATIQIFEFGW